MHTEDNMEITYLRLDYPEDKKAHVFLRGNLQI